MNLSFRVKLFIAISLLSSGTALICVVYFYNAIYHNVWSQMADRMKDIGRTGQFLFKDREREIILRLDRDSEEFAHLRFENEFKKVEDGDTFQYLPPEVVEKFNTRADFLALVQILRQIKSGTRNKVTPLKYLSQVHEDMNDIPRIRFVYLLSAIPESPDHMYVKFIADGDFEGIDINQNGKIDQSESPTSVGEIFYVKGQPELREAFSGKVTATRESFEDKWGRWFSSYTPVFDKSGKVLAVMGVDISATSEHNFLNTLWYICIGIIVVSFIASMFGSFLVSRKLSRPLHSLREGAERVRDRDFTTRVEGVRGGDEFGMLAETFNAMVEEIKNYSQNLEAMVETRTRQLQEALENVQRLKTEQDGDYFLTTLLTNPLFKNYNKSESVLSEFLIEQKKQFKFKERQGDLGGDLCVTGNLNFNGRNFTMFMNGDAMGKSMQGAGGALVLGTVMNSILNRSVVNNRVLYMSPEKWLADAHDELHRVLLTFDGSMYASCVIGLIEEQTGILKFFNAEHPFCVLYRGGNASFLEEDINLPKLGMPMPVNFSVHEFQLKPGDVVIVGSDGRDDLNLGGGGPSGRNINSDDRLFLRVVAGARGELASIRENMREFGSVIDDVSLIRLKYTGGQEIKASSNNGKNIMGEVIELVRKKRYQDALKIMERESLEGQGFLPLYYRGFCLSKLGRPDEAIEVLERAQRHEGQQVAVYRLLGRAYTELGQFDDAEKWYSEAALLQPDNIYITCALDVVRKKRNNNGGDSSI